MRSVVSAGTSCLALLLSATSTGAPPRHGEHTPLNLFKLNLDRGGQYAPGELLVRTHPQVEAQQVAAKAQTLGCAIEQKVGLRPLYLLECSTARPMEALIAAWQEVDGVAWVEAGFTDELEAVPNDLAELQWYHDNVGQTIDGVAGTRGADMSSVAAWDVTAGARERVIAIIDVGLYPGHLDLMGNFWRNPGEICGNGRDDDGNGYVDDCNGWDFGEGDPDPTPLTLQGDSCLRWHGTYIAGLAGAVGNNRQGIAGTAWTVSLMNIKRHRDSSCSSTSARNAAAVTYAMDNGADAIGMSFNSTTYSAEFERALQEADVRGMITVMSAGNGGNSIETANRYPNNYDIQNKIIVASTNNRDQLDPGSNYGRTRVHLAAPGTYVISTAIEGPMAYGVGTGTSMSVGFVLGAVALTKTAYPNLSGAQVRQSILQGSQALNNLNCASNTRCVASGRRLDLLGALQHASQGTPARLEIHGVSVREVGNGDGVFGPGERGLVELEVRNTGSGTAWATSAQLQLEVGVPAVSVPTPETPVGNVQPGGSVRPSGAGQPSFDVGAACNNVDATARFRITVAERLGQTASATFEAPIRCPRREDPVDAGTPEPDSGLVDDAGAPAPDSGVLETPDSGAGGPMSGEEPQDPWEEEPLRRDRGGCTSTAPGAAPFGFLLSMLALALRRRR